MQSLRPVGVLLVVLAACGGSTDSNTGAPAGDPGKDATGCDACGAGGQVTAALGPCEPGTLPTTGRLFDQVAGCASPETTVLACYPDIGPDAYTTQGSGCYVHEPTGAVFTSVWDGPELSGEYVRCEGKYGQIRDAAAGAETCGGSPPPPVCGAPDSAGECPSGCTPVMGARWDAANACVAEEMALSWCAYTFADAPPSWCVVDEATGDVYLKARGVPAGYRQCTAAELPATSVLKCP